MPGILSGLFSDVHDGQAKAENMAVSMEEWADDRAAEHDQSHDNEAGAEAHVNPTINIHHEASVSWENSDGSEGKWSTNEDVTLTVDVDAAVEAASHIDHTQYDA